MGCVERAGGVPTEDLGPGPGGQCFPPHQTRVHRHTRLLFLPEMLSLCAFPSHCQRRVPPPDPATPGPQRVARAQGS